MGSTSRQAVSKHGYSGTGSIEGSIHLGHAWACYLANELPTRPDVDRNKVVKSAGPMREGMKRAMITGIAGQDGSYLTELLLTKDYEVHGIIRRASAFNRASPRRGESFVTWKITRAVAHIKAGLQDKLDRTGICIL